MIDQNRKMNFIVMDVNEYLAPSAYIDFDAEPIQRLAKQLSSTSATRQETAKKCFEWVRDNIKHSVDYQLNPVTCKASDVLKYETGYCYAKSHLLAALLRANHIPAGLCYQRLSIDDKGAPFCLHGLNAVYLENFGWYRVDARGNKAGVDAQFIPPEEKLAFPIQFEEECDFPDVYVEPLEVVVAALEKYSTYQDVLVNLPDCESN